MKIRLEELRELNKLSQEEVARSVGLSLTQYRNIEKGRSNNFNYKILFKFKEVFKLKNVEDLFEKQKE